MIGKARHLIGIFMVAVALCASSLHGYSAVLEAFESHTHGPTGSHAHHAGGASLEASHQAAHDHDQDRADACEGAGCEEPKSASHCAYMHTHCCTTLAVQAGDCSLKLSYQPAAVEPERASLLPLGQLSNPLFRPPRASV
jgi:hypothetical protein